MSRQHDSLRRDFAHQCMLDEVRSRDTYKCQSCGTSKGRLEVHHLIPISKLSWEDNADLFSSMDNLITLCSDCHKIADRDKTFNESLKLKVKNKNSPTIKKVALHTKEVSAHK